MAKPTADVHWATSDINNVEPDGTLKDEGWGTDEIPTSANANWMFNAIGAFIIWLASWFDDAGHLLELDHIVDADYNLLEGLAPITIHEFPMPFWVSGFQVDDELVSGDGHFNPALRNTGAGAAYVALKIPEGYRLKNVTAKAVSDGTHALILSVYSQPVATGAAGLVIALPAITSASPADASLSCYGHRPAGTSVVVGGSAGVRTYTRTVGSWTTDGFQIGQQVAIAGFSNGANNLSGPGVDVTAVSATVLTVTDPSLGSPVVETSSAGTFDTASSMTDATQHMALLLNASGGSGIGIRSLRYTYARVP